MSRTNKAESTVKVALITALATIAAAAIPFLLNHPSQENHPVQENHPTQENHPSQDDEKIRQELMELRQQITVLESQIRQEQEHPSANTNSQIVKLQDSKARLQGQINRIEATKPH